MQEQRCRGRRSRPSAHAHAQRPLLLLQLVGVLWLTLAPACSGAVNVCVFSIIAKGKDHLVVERETRMTGDLFAALLDFAPPAAAAPTAVAVAAKEKDQKTGSTGKEKSKDQKTAPTAAAAAAVAAHHPDALLLTAEVDAPAGPSRPPSRPGTPGAAADDNGWGEVPDAEPVTPRRAAAIAAEAKREREEAAAIAKQQTHELASRLAAKFGKCQAEGKKLLVSYHSNGGGTNIILHALAQLWLSQRAPAQPAQLQPAAAAAAAPAVRVIKPAPVVNAISCSPPEYGGANTDSWLPPLAFIPDRALHAAYAEWFYGGASPAVRAFCVATGLTDPSAAEILAAAPAPAPAPGVAAAAPAPAPAPVDPAVGIAAARAAAKQYVAQHPASATAAVRFPRDMPAGDAVDPAWVVNVIVHSDAKSMESLQLLTYKGFDIATPAGSALLKARNNCYSKNYKDKAPADTSAALKVSKCLRDLFPAVPARDVARVLPFVEAFPDLAGAEKKLTTAGAQPIPASIRGQFERVLTMRAKPNELIGDEDWDQKKHSRSKAVHMPEVLLLSMSQRTTTSHTTGAAARHSTVLAKAKRMRAAFRHARAHGRA